MENHGLVHQDADVGTVHPVGVVNPHLAQVGDGSNHHGGMMPRIPAEVEATWGKWQGPLAQVSGRMVARDHGITQGDDCHFALDQPGMQGLVVDRAPESGAVGLGGAFPDRDPEASRGGPGVQDEPPQEPMGALTRVAGDDGRRVV